LNIAAPIKLSAPNLMTVMAIRQHGVLSRSNIAEQIGYSNAKITGVVNDLIEQNILLEMDEAKSSGGRRARYVGFNPDFGYIVTINIGVTKLELALIDFGENIRIRRMLPINIKDGPETILTEICSFILDRIQQLKIPLEKIFAFVATLPGAIDSETQTPFETPLMPTWAGYQIENHLSQAFPYAVIQIENDANALAFGELRKGIAQEVKNFIYVKVGTTISAGIIINGKIYRGANGRAGDIGQMYVEAINFEGEVAEIIPLNLIASGAAIAQQAREAVENNYDTLLTEYELAEITAREVGQIAAKGDEFANQIIQQSGEVIGKSIANIVNFLDPELILIGGSVSNIGRQFLASIRRSILERSPALTTHNLRIEQATLASEASTLGAMALALESVFVLDE
jgi:predicted NBD/HSP70 family sugar kinase